VTLINDEIVEDDDDTAFQEIAIVIFISLNELIVIFCFSRIFR